MARTIDSDLQIEIHGSEDTLRSLERMAAALGPERVEPFLREGADIIANDARRRAPVGPTGNLKRGIVSKILQRKPGQSPAALVAVDYRIAPHARFVEFGAKNRVWGAGTKQPGRTSGVMPERPFLRPAYDTRRAEVDALIRQRIAEAMGLK